MGVFFRKKSEEEMKQQKLETNAEKKAKRLEELKKEIEGKPKKISEENSNDMTDYPIGDGKEYPSNSNMPRIRGILPPGFQEPQEIKEGGLVRFKKQYQMHNGKF